MKNLYYLLTLLYIGLTYAQNDPIINFIDPKFKNMLVTGVNPKNNSTIAVVNGYYGNMDTNHDKEIQESEALKVSSLSLSDADLTDLTGIEKFLNLTDLYFYNNSISSIDLSALVKLERLNASTNKFTSLDVTHNINLLTLECSENKITSLDISQNSNLERLYCYSNLLNTIDISKNLKLILFSCSLNQIQNLDLSKSIEMISLECFGNKLTTLDLSHCPKLEILHCNSNQLSNLDLTKNSGIFDLDFSNNLMETVFMKCACYLFALELKNNPNLRYICVHDINLEFVQNAVNSAGYANCNVNSYCSFVPGGAYNIVQGKQILDTNSNGCDANDLAYPNMKFLITDGFTTGTMIANNSGDFTIPVLDGDYEITPIFENPQYFTASPSKINVSFPAQTSPYAQNLCVVPNGSHSDLEVVLFPIMNAVPGFDHVYYIEYKNNGTHSQSGTISFNFDDTKSDIVSSNPLIQSQQVGKLTWDFTNLKPFETGEIILTLNLNAPTETPSLNSGDILVSTASIQTAEVEETPLDNVSMLHETVVNSHDPNDKTCLEGNTVTPELIGQYAHYVVRFENTGTLEARNIVVKDMIDTAKFDVSSLIVTNSSHSCVTKISETNKVEFIFENINLPFDNASNDGYIAFKIKTLPSLKVGDTFSNTADIFFDYNFPITTNEAKTTVQAPLNTSDFAFENYFSLYPNPTKNMVSLNTKNNIEVKNINILNTLGQLVLSIPNAQTISNFDVSRLNTGTYFVKITTNKGTSTTKFIKE